MIMKINQHDILILAETTEVPSLLKWSQYYKFLGKNKIKYDIFIPVQAIKIHTTIQATVNIMKVITFYNK